MIDASCNSIDLRNVFDDSASAQQQREIEKHLEECESCQERLTSLAADSTLWSQAACHLSTISELALPDRVSTQLNLSNSFVVPGIDTGEQGGQSLGSVGTDWTKVLDPPTHPEMLGRIDHFEIESKIGSGGMGIVLKGFDRGLNRAVAIKILAPHLAANGTARRRFAREAQAAAAVVHPNVVRIYSVQKSAERPYIVMELGPNETLQSLVQEQGPIDATDVIRISLQIASGLEAAHKIGLIHRDVKPGNALVEHDVSRVMITDFGLARAVDDAGMTQTGWIAGTPHYMSPEQAKGDELDARTDLFSLGSLMYFLATGREPFRGEKPYAVIQKIIANQPLNATESNSDVPPMLADIIEKLLEKDTKDRFQSARELIQVLQQYLAHLQQPKKTQPPKRILTVRRKRKRAWIIGSTTSAILATVVICLLWKFSANKTNNAAPTIAAPSITSPTPQFIPKLSYDEFESEIDSISREIKALERSFQSFHAEGPNTSGGRFELLQQIPPNQNNKSTKLKSKRNEDEK